MGRLKRSFEGREAKSFFFMSIDPIYFEDEDRSLTRNRIPVRVRVEVVLEVGSWICSV